MGQRQPKIFIYEADGLGSVTSLTDPTGAIAATYTYDSFGFMTASTGSATNWFRYTGRQFDSTGGLYYYRARYYDPTTGRFLSEDPIRFKGGVNFYAYVGNDPVNRTDPFGLSPNCHLDPKSRCAQLFQQFFGITPSQFNAAVNNVPWFYMPSIKAMGNITWDFLSGNGNTTQIGGYFQSHPGVEAATATGGSLSNPAPVVLGPDWFMDANPAHVTGTMLHEAVHSITGWTDAQIFDVFSQYGLPDADWREYSNTDGFTQWLMDGCPQ